MTSFMVPASSGWYSYTPAGQNLGMVIRILLGNNAHCASPALGAVILGVVETLGHGVVHQGEVGGLVRFVVSSLQGEKMLDRNF